MDGTGATSNYMVTASQFLGQRDSETSNLMTDIQKPPKMEVTEISGEKDSEFDYGLIITVTFFGTLGFGMVAVMLAGLWYRLCEKRRPKTEEEEKQSDDQDYKHLQMISRSSSYNPPPCLGVSGSVAVAGGGDDKGDHKGETLATGGWGSLENSLDCAHGGRGRSYRLLNGHSEDVIEIKIDQADGDERDEGVGKEDGLLGNNSDPFLAREGDSRKNSRYDIDSFRSLSENSVAATRKSSKQMTHDLRQFCSHENFPTSKKTSCSGGGGLDGDIELGNANGYNKIPDKLLHSASNVISDVTQGRPPQCELHKNIRNSNSSHDRSSTNLNNKNKNSSNNSSNISNNEVDDTFGNAGFKYNPQRVSEVAVSPKLGVRHVNKAGSRENCSYPSNTNNRPANRSVSNSPNSKSSSSPRCTNNNNNNSNSHRNSQTLKNNNNINNSPASSNSGRQRGDDRLHGSRNSGILDENKRVQSFDSDNREVDFFYDNLHCARDWYADSKTKNSTSPHHLKAASQNSSRKFHRPSLTRQAQIFISVPSSRDQNNRRSYQLPVKESFPLSKTPPITVSHTFDMGEAFSSCGNTDGHERQDSSQQISPDSSSRLENSPRPGSRSRKLNIFKRHHSANISNETHSAGSCDTNTNNNSITTLVQNSPKRSQEFLQVPNFQPGRGVTLGVGGSSGGSRGDNVRRSSFGDRQHPAWKSAESYHMRPEMRRSFDERMQHYHPCMSQKNPVFNHSTVSLQQHLMSRERSDSDEQFHAAPPGDHRRCSCVPANTPHLSSHNSSVDKQSPHNSRDFLPPPIRLPLNQPEIKVTGSFANLNKMSPLLENKRENSKYVEKKRENSLNYGVSDIYFPAQKLPKNDDYTRRSFDAGYDDYHASHNGRTKNSSSSRFEPGTYREQHSPLRLQLDPITSVVKDTPSPVAISPVSPSSSLAASGRQLWDLRTTLEQDPSDDEDDEKEESNYENIIDIEKRTSFEMQDEATDYPFNTHGLNRVFDLKHTNEQPDAPASPRRKLPPTPVAKTSISSVGHPGFDSSRKPSLTFGVGRVPMFAAASFDSSGTPDSECSGTAQIVGARRKFSSSISITDDFNTEPECFSDSSHNVRRIRNSTSSYDTSNLPSSASYLTTSAKTESHGSHMHHHHHHHTMHANGGATEVKSKATLSAMNISQIGLQTRNSYALVSREEDSLELDLLKEKIVQETERNKTSELAKSRRNAYHKRRSGQVSESLEFPHDDGSNPGTSNLSGYPVFKGVNDMNESLTSSGSLNDVDNDSSITVNRRLIPPSYRAVLPAGRDYSIDKKTDMIFREFLKTDNATILKMKYGYKSPRRMKHSPRNTPSARPMVQQGDSIEETEAESGEGEPNSLGMTSSNLLSGARQVSDPKGPQSDNHLSVGYIPSSDANSDWLTDDFLYRRTRRLLPPIKSQDSTSSDPHMPGSVHLSRNSSINKP